MTLQKVCFLVLSVSFPTAICHAQSVSTGPSGDVTWQAGVDGVKIDFDNGHHVRRIYSKVSHPVSINDKRGIKTAMIIAEEKAKANIVRFLQQDVTSGRAVTEVDATLSKTLQQKDRNGDSISTTDQRNLVQNLTEFSGSISSGVIRGVIVLEQGYDPKEQEVWVVAGVSDKTIAAAKAAGEMMAAPDPATTKTDAAPSHGSAPGIRIQRNNSDF